MPMMYSDKIEITLGEYYDLCVDSETLSRLERCGVDNWPGCRDSIYSAEENDGISFEDFCRDLKKEIFG